MTSEPQSNNIKDTVRELVYRCPLGEHIPSCPFAILALLTHSSREALLDELSEDSCLRLFELTGPCKCPRDPRPPK